MEWIEQDNKAMRLYIERVRKGVITPIPVDEFLRGETS